MRTKLLASALLATIALGSTSEAATLDIQGGELAGAFGVNVGGTLFDVSFGNGSCDGFFNGCDNPSDFTFQNETDALDAAAALLNQVFLDGILTFDTDPERTAGCEDLNVCQALIPFGLINGDVQVAYANNGVVDLADQALLRLFQTDQTTSGLEVFAQFSPATAAAVPLPATSLLLGWALFGLGGLSRRRKN